MNCAIRPLGEFMAMLYASAVVIPPRVPPEESPPEESLLDEPLPDEPLPLPPEPDESETESELESDERGSAAAARRGSEPDEPEREEPEPDESEPEPVPEEPELPRGVGEPSTTSRTGWVAESTVLTVSLTGRSGVTGLRACDGALSARIAASRRSPLPVTGGECDSLTGGGGGAGR
jgi:hypothetical protein